MRLLAAFCFSALMLQGCFTGVESTPRIKADEVRRQHAATKTPEQVFLADIEPLPPSQWVPGQYSIFITGQQRLPLVFPNATGPYEGLQGKVLTFAGFRPVQGLVTPEVEAVFQSESGDLYPFRTKMQQSQLDTLRVLDVPFSIPMDMVRRVSDCIKDKDYFVKTPHWYDTPTRNPIRGVRYVPVHIDSVTPGNDLYPVAVSFTITDSRVSGPSSGATVFMTLGSGRTSTRNFDTLFSFTDPRRTHPEIKDDVWALIINSRVREGMTREECRLALGNPPELSRIPTYGGVREVWTYSDGVFLVFDDGFLTRYRL